MTSLVAAQATQADILSGAATKQTKTLPACPHPLLTPAESFNTVARGNPKPHTLTGKDLVKARMTPETWRLEITADSRVEPPHVTQPARMQAPRTLKDGTALDLETLRELGKSQPVVLTGKVISGLSGLDRVEYSLRRVAKDAEPLDNTGHENLDADWHPCRIYPPPNWEQILPHDVKPHQLLGLNAKTGQPKTWPLHCGLGYWGINLHGLQAGVYEARLRTVDGNGFAQPAPRPLSKSGGNAVEMQRFRLS